MQSLRKLFTRAKARPGGNGPAIWWEHGSLCVRLPDEMFTDRRRAMRGNNQRGDLAKTDATNEDPPQPKEFKL